MDNFMEELTGFNWELYFIYIILDSGLRQDIILCKIIEEFLWETVKERNKISIFWFIQYLGNILIKKTRKQYSP